MKIVIIGGHLTPALSVIEDLWDTDEVLYVGRKHSFEGDSALSLEYETITKKGIPFVDLKTGRFQRKISKHTIPSLIKIPFGLGQSIKILRSYKPDVVVGFGGYVSFPVVLAARLLKIPTLIHEQTLEAGAANKFLGKYTDRVCISFKSSATYFPKDKTILTGNPIRRSIIYPNEKFDIPRKGLVIYITGGSQGSHAINLLVAEILPKILDKYIVIHQTGSSAKFKDFEKLSILKDGLNESKRNKYILSKYFSVDEIGSILKLSTIVVGRSGINTITELIALNKPAILIPLPAGQLNEQQNNANYLKSLGLAKVYDQENLTSVALLMGIDEMIENLQSYKLNESLDSDFKFAAKKIVKAIYDISKNGN